MTKSRIHPQLTHLYVVFCAFLFLFPFFRNGPMPNSLLFCRDHLDVGQKMENEDELAEPVSHILKSHLIITLDEIDSLDEID